MNATSLTLASSTMSCCKRFKRDGRFSLSDTIIQVHPEIFPQKCDMDQDYYLSLQAVSQRSSWIDTSSQWSAEGGLLACLLLFQV